MDAKATKERDPIAMSKDIQFDMKLQENRTDEMTAVEKKVSIVINLILFFQNLRAALKKIEEATGVSQLDDIILKIQKHPETSQALKDMQKSL